MCVLRQMAMLLFQVYLATNASVLVVTYVCIVTDGNAIVSGLSG